MKLSCTAAATVLALVLAACASPSSANDGTADSVGELNATEAAAAPITLENWLAHPKIVAVRKIVNAVDAANFVPKTKKLCENAGRGEFERSLSTDAHGVARELVLAFGSDDSATTDSYYYDEAGTLRFLFRTHNDVAGREQEFRVYFDEQGKRIWEVARFAHSDTFDADITKSPYQAPFETIAIDEQAAKPGAIFDSPPRCD